MLSFRLKKQTSKNVGDTTFKAHNIVKEPGTVNLAGTSKLSAFVRKLLVFMRHTLTNKKSLRKF